MLERDTYPLALERRLDTRLWGGQRLNDLLGLEPPVAQLAEAWLVFDSNQIANGPLAGYSLAEATTRLGAALVGTRSFARYGADFPLLAKFIDAAQPLSVQVHPDDAYAHAHEAATGFHGKTEAWHILAAEAGAELIYGLRRPATRDEIAQAIADETLLGILATSPVAAGDTVMVPAGTIHAIGAGVTLFEIQQKSDLTYRLYDYGRRDAQGQFRELHVEKALDVSDLSGATPLQALALPLDESGSRSLLVACPFFALERLGLSEPLQATTDAGSFEILTCLEGQGALEWEGGAVPLAAGAALLLPAALGTYALRSTGGTTLLRCYVPDLDGELLPRLRAHGATQQQIGRSVFRLG
jgi:mannose-6-phosphate isomerase